MKILFSNTLAHQLSFQFPTPILVFNFPSLSRQNPRNLNFPNRKWLFTPKTSTFCSSTSSGELSYGGWVDEELDGNSVQSGEYGLLNSLGIDDKKYIFVYLLGFVCALAISRVRVSSIVVFPACLLVFAVGFSIGIVNGGHMNELSLNGSKKRSKDEYFRVLIDKLRSLVDIFNGVDVKIVNLKGSVREHVKSNQITRSDLESYIKAMDSIGLSALQGKSMVEGYIDTMLVDNQEVSRILSQKLSNRKKEVHGTGFGLSQFVDGFLKNSVGSKPNKAKDIVKKDSATVEAIDQSRVNILPPAVEGKMLHSQGNDNMSNGKGGFIRDTPANRIRAQDSVEGKAYADLGRMNSMEMESGAKTFFDSEEYLFQKKKISFVENEHISRGHQDSAQAWASQDGLLDLDFNISLKQKRTGASFGEGRRFIKINGNNMPTDNIGNDEKETYKSCMREEQMMSKNDPSLTHHHSAQEDEFFSSPSSMVSDDMLFNKYLTEANILLKQARENLRHRGDEGDAENALYESARLLSKAVEMKPMSLLAVGQLGNTYLLHGEVKLRMSRELRALLARSNPLSGGRAKVLEGLDDRILSKEKVADSLANVCEECEELLVKAGRKYKLALSIDGNDMRALYNWGLALSFRAQLIADIGPEAAFDADKVYMAAIDKFDAMMSKSNVFAPDALFRWGVALQQRSRLRTRNTKEKVKLLNQAKRLYEDALHMDSGNTHVRSALSACISELNYRDYY